MNNTGWYDRRDVTAAEVQAIKAVLRLNLLTLKGSDSIALAIAHEELAQEIRQEAARGEPH